MHLRHRVHAGARTAGIAAVVFGLCGAGIVQGVSANAQSVLPDAASRAKSARSLEFGQSSDYQPAFHLDYLHRGSAKECQVPLPPIGAVSPFPLALRLGAVVSPRTKFVGGIDATIPGLHLLPNASSRVDLDAIVSVNFGSFGRSSTIVPLTFDQIFNLNLPISSRVYAGGGIGPYFGDKTRFGGKLIVGAEFNRFGLEGNIHFAGIGDTLFTVQARIGL